MPGFIDLHSHWIPGIDDGVRSPEEGVALLQALRQIGFVRVVATPHMRPGLFDNDRAAIEAAYAAMLPRLEGQPGLPEVALASEHFFEDTVFHRLLAGQGLTYPGGKSLLIELHAEFFPMNLVDRVLDLRRRKLRPVLAHPERYAQVWARHTVLDELIDAGAALLLDVAALSGKYGRKPQKSAELLLEQGYYSAACSDAHRPADVAEVQQGIERMRSLAGAEETEFLLAEGPQRILDDRL